VGVPGPRVRLAALVAGLVALWVVFGLTGAVREEDVRRWVDAAGPLAPLAFVPLSAALGLLLVPGPLLSAASGLLFGTAVGVGVSLAAAVLSALAAQAVGRRIGAEGAAQLGGARLEAVGAFLERRGLVAVVVQRLTPAVPDGPVNYAAGLVRLRPRDLALGTLIGSAPRAFAYTALGDSLDDLTSPLALAALSVLVLAGLAGTLLAGRAVVHARRRRRGPPPGVAPSRVDGPSVEDASSTLDAQGRPTRRRA
jgi:uncharacterized membrane protein YdjX (TVP38/TMEM64 family)